MPAAAAVPVLPAQPPVAPTVRPFAPHAAPSYGSAPLHANRAIAVAQAHMCPAMLPGAKLLPCCCCCGPMAGPACFGASARPGCHCWWWQPEGNCCPKIVGCCPGSPHLCAHVLQLCNLALTPCSPRCWHAICCCTGPTTTIPAAAAPLAATSAA